MKIFNIVFAILFVVFAGLQYNDPDPYLWIPIYLFAAFICFMGARKKFYPVLTLLGLLFYAGYALYLFFEKDGVIDWVTEHKAENIAGQMKAATPWIEDTREFFGLLLTSFALAMNYFYQKRLRKTR